MSNITKTENGSIIALVGPIASGKGTVANLLIEKGYKAFNYGDIIYIERTARGLKEERKNSNAVGAELRLKYGNNIIAKKLCNDIDAYKSKKLGNKILIDGLRHPDEVIWVKKYLGAKVIGITALPEIRYLRSLKRNRIVDPKSSEEFKEVDIEDRGLNAEAHKNQSEACLAYADIIIENNGENRDEYIKEFNVCLEKIESQ